MSKTPRWAQWRTAEIDPSALSALLAVATQLDGADTLDEAQVLALHSDACLHGVLIDDDASSGANNLLGYLQVPPADVRTGDVSAAVVVGARSPGFSRTDIASLLLTAAESHSEPGRLVVWSRSDAAPVGRAAVRREYAPDRVLLTMSRPLTAADAAFEPAAGVDIRAFVPGQDDAAWVELNAAAFAAHPEQGAWTAADLAERMSQPWFDPAGFLLAVEAGSSQDGPLLGFHWTKLHAGTPSGGTGATAPTGEVYVLGTAPGAQGRGIGTALLSAGLAYLRHAGAREVLLYVDEANATAVRLYQRSGFQVVRRQVQYRRP